MAKSMDEALATLGQMKFRIPASPETPNEALLMIRHPNNSGLQMDQVTRLYTPSRYIDKLAVYSSTSCPRRRAQEICRRMPFGETNQAPISRAACGCPTPVTGSLLPSCSTTFAADWTRLWPVARFPSFSIALRIAGCPGTRPSARCRWAMPMSPGIRRVPMAGPPPARGEAGARTAT